MAAQNCAVGHFYRNMPVYNAVERHHSTAGVCLYAVSHAGPQTGCRGGSRRRLDHWALYSLLFCLALWEWWRRDGNPIETKHDLGFAPQSVVCVGRWVCGGGAFHCCLNWLCELATSALFWQHGPSNHFILNGFAVYSRPGRGLMESRTGVELCFCIYGRCGGRFTGDASS